MTEALSIEALRGVMTTRRIVGLALVALGMVVLLWGGVFWTDKDTVLDVGSLEVTSESREGVAIPSVIGAIALIGGIVLVLIPNRRPA